MEQHKVLLIIVSVTIVLAAVVGVGLWLFYPRDGADTELAQGTTPESGGYEWQPLDYLQGEGEVPGLEETEPETSDEPDEFEVTYGVVPDTGPSGTDPRTVIDTVEPTSAADTSTGVSEPATTDPSGATAPTMVSVPAAADVAATTNGDRADAPSTTAPTTASPASAPSTSAGADGELADRAYWVQAISSPNRDTVEQAQLTLREHQLGSRMLTKVIEGRTFYRLRIGPFAVRAEAEKFLGWVQAISGFGDSMIFVDYTTPVLAARVD